MSLAVHWEYRASKIVVSEMVLVRPPANVTVAPRSTKAAEAVTFGELPPMKAQSSRCVFTKISWRSESFVVSFRLNLSFSLLSAVASAGLFPASQALSREYWPPVMNHIRSRITGPPRVRVMSAKSSRSKANASGAPADTGSPVPASA